MLMPKNPTLGILKSPLDRLARLDPKLLTAASLLLINVLSMLYIFIFGGYFFRDYSIIFDGGMRVSLGQVPYRDFFTPTGPVVFYMQALFNNIFGINALAMSAHCAVVNALVLSMFFLYAKRFLEWPLAVGLTALLHFTYYGATVNPWYNHTALFFYFAAQLLSWRDLDENRPSSLGRTALMALLLTLSFFSKQDIGALGTAFILSQTLLFQPKGWRTALALCASMAGLTALIAGYYSSVSDFGYWFNYGQPPHVSRMEELKGLLDLKWLVKDFRFYALLAAPLLLLKVERKRQTLFLLYCVLGLTGFSLIVTRTSGLRMYTSYSFTAFILLFLIRALAGSEKLALSRGKARIAAYALCGIVAANIHHFTGLNLYPIKFYFETVPLSEGSYRGKRFTLKSLEGIAQVRRELKRRKGTRKDWLLNMSEYAFFYRDFGVEPPTPMHLWYHRTVTLFDKDYEVFKEKVAARKFEYILVQEMASGTPPPEFRDYLATLGYRNVLAVPTSKSEGRGLRYDLTVYRLVEK